MGGGPLDVAHVAEGAGCAAAAALQEGGSGAGLAEEAAVKHTSIHTRQCTMHAGERLGAVAEGAGQMGHASRGRADWLMEVISNLNNVCIYLSAASTGGSGWMRPEELGF